MNFEHLKVGDQVTRLLAGKLPMKMQVTKVNSDTIECSAVKKDGSLTTFEGWTFDRNSGVEEDADLKWGIKFGKTGSYLIPET